MSKEKVSLRNLIGWAVSEMLATETEKAASDNKLQ
jgi:hypothetical protein